MKEKPTSPKRPTTWQLFLCAVLWHKPGRVAQLNLASAKQLERWCTRCGERLIQNSQGNWFAVKGA